MSIPSEREIKMGDNTFKSDTTPYLVFACTKCHQYSYVKTTQKTKKCLRCNRTHKVADILKTGEIVKGITNALKYVKEKQNQLANPDLVSENEFVIGSDLIIKENPNNKIIVLDEEESIEQKFGLLLKEIGKFYSTFPRYAIEALSDKYNIPQSSLKNLIRKFEKIQVLIKLENGYFKLNF